MAVSTRPLSGTGSAMTTSKADMRSEATNSTRPSPSVVDVADLAGVQVGERRHDGLHCVDELLVGQVLVSVGLVEEVAQLELEGSAQLHLPLHLGQVSGDRVA